MAAPLRAGIIGTGFMGSVHAQAVRAAGHTLVGFAGSTPDKAHAMANENGGVGFSSVDSLLGSDDIDVVHVCTPNHLHRDHAVRALQHGKHVVCEKPLATTAQDGEALVLEAGRANRKGFVPFVYRFYPAVQEMRHRIAQGDAGPIHLIHGSYLQDWLASATASNWRVNSTTGGPSRTFGDIGVHWCDLMEHVTGHRITRLMAKTDTVFAQRNGTDVATEDAVHILFETNAGATGSFLASQVSLGRKNKIVLEVDGPLAAFAFDHTVPNQLWMGETQKNTVIESGPETLHAPSALSLQTIPSGHPMGYTDAFRSFIHEAYRTIPRDDAPGIVATFDDGLRAIHLTEAVIASAKQSQWVTVGDNNLLHVASVSSGITGKDAS
jgi:predicted dehydrogenase